MMFAAFSVQAREAVDYQCPETIDLSWNITSSHDGWENAEQDPALKKHYFDSVMFSYGRGNGFLKLDGDDVTVIKEYRVAMDDEMVSIADTIVTHPLNIEDIWIVCRYRQTNATVTRSVLGGAHVTACSVEHKAMNARYNHIICY